MASKRFDDGMAVRRAVLGAEHVDRQWNEAKQDPFTLPLQEMVTEVGWGMIWARPGLSRRDRSVINLAMLTALNRPHEFELHLKGAINNGVSKEEVLEILIQCAGYCGFPAAIDSFRIARRIYREREESGAAAAAPAAEAKPKAARKPKAKAPAAAKKKRATKS